ncbi:unnamed protein product, partial [Brassica oleracea var. botrytis]
MSRKHEWSRPYLNRICSIGSTSVSLISKETCPITLL